MSIYIPSFRIRIIERTGDGSTTNNLNINPRFLHRAGVEGEKYRYSFQQKPGSYSNFILRTREAFFTASSFSGRVAIRRRRQREREVEPHHDAIPFALHLKKFLFLFMKEHAEYEIFIRFINNVKKCNST